jgi:membrane associated rhomboid family serine protease
MVRVIDQENGDNLELKENDSLGSQSNVEIIEESNIRQSRAEWLVARYKTFVLNSNVPGHEKLRDNDGKINQINRYKVYDQVLRKKTTDISQEEEDQADGQSVPAWLEPSRRKEFESENLEDIDQFISCTPKFRPSRFCLFTYTGFPLFLTITSLIQIIVFAYYYSGDRCNNCEISKFNSEMMNSALILPPVKDLFGYGEIWRVWTYQFLHANIEHLVTNVLLQFLAGATLEIVHGPLRTGVLYTTGVIIGGCFHIIISPQVALVGASGGGYTLLGVSLANVAMNYKEMNIYGKFIRILVLSLFMAAEIAVGIDRMSDENDQNVSWACHLGGALVGLSFGIVILKNFVLEKKEIYAQLVFLILFTLLLIATSTTLLVKYAIYL